MEPVYAIFGFEWFTNERGAAPEVSEYMVLEITPKPSSWIEVAVNNEFLKWKDYARERVWRKVVSDSELLSCGFVGLTQLIDDFKKNSSASWYFLDKEEFDGWVEAGTFVRKITLDS